MASGLACRSAVIAAQCLWSTVLSNLDVKALPSSGLVRSALASSMDDEEIRRERARSESDEAWFRAQPPSRPHTQQIRHRSRQ
jgi:hypothetical protein